MDAIECFFCWWILQGFRALSVLCLMCVFYIFRSLQIQILWTLTTFLFTASNIPVIYMPREKGRLYLPALPFSHVLAIVRGPLGTLRILGGAVWFEAKWCLALRVLGPFLVFVPMESVTAQWRWTSKAWASNLQGSRHDEGWKPMIDMTLPSFGRWWWEFRKHCQPV